MKLGRMAHLIFLAAWCFGTPNGFAQDPPPGFTDQTLLNEVMSGTVVTSKTIDTDTEEDVFLRAFMKAVQPADYTNIIVTYENYPSMFPEVTSATTTNVNADKTIYEYSMDITFYYDGFVPIYTTPQGRHTITLPSGDNIETHIHHQLLNYTDTFSLAEENIRAIPWQGGILVEDEIHAKLVQAGSTAETIKDDLVSEFSKFLTTFRRTLKGVP